MTNCRVFSRLRITPARCGSTFHTVAGARATRIRNTPVPDRVLAQVLLGDPVLALPGLAVDHRNTVGLRRRTDPAGEPAGQPHQMRVVQPLVAVVVPATPPGPEAARRMPQRK